MAVSLCPGCNSRDQRIADLEKLVGTLKLQNAELKKQRDEAQRSRKRQTAPFSKGPPNAHPKTPGRKAGEQHGKHGHRPPPTPEEIHETLDAPLPNVCPECGGDIAEDDDTDEQFQTDLPPQPVVKKIIIHKGCCKRCGKRVRGRLPEQTSDAVGAAASQIGPHAQATITYLNKHAGMSYSKMSHYFRDVFHFELKPSTCTRIVLRNAQKLQPVYDEIANSLKTAERITPDETGWRIGGRPAWLHAWVTERATCYAIDPHRSADALEKIIGIDYSGTMIHDGASTYDRFLAALHQQCVAHPTRRAHHLEMSQPGRAQLFPRQVIDLFQSALKLRDEFVAGERSQAKLDDAYVDHLVALWELTERCRAPEANDVLRRHLRNHAEEWFPFLLFPEQPATNYEAEQALRLPIENRKVFGGNRTTPGGKAQAIICSTIRTCEQQKQSPIQFIKDAICRGISALRSIFTKTQ